MGADAFYARHGNAALGIENRMTGRALGTELRHLLRHNYVTRQTGERSMDPLRWGLIPHWASATCLEKVKLPAERVLHIDHLFARMPRLNTYEAKTNAMTRIGSNLSQVLPPPFSCE